MKDKYLPGNISDRIRELRERDKMTQTDLAAKLDISPSTLGRIEKGEIGKVSSDKLIKLAQIFGVTTDFLLGITDSPDRASCNAQELGLSPEAVRRLRSGVVNTDALNGMVTSRYFPAMSQHIAAYTEGTVSEGIKTHNNIMSAAMNMLSEHPEAKADIATAKIPGTIEQENITALMRYLLKDMKERTGQSVAAENAARDTQVAEAVTKEIASMVDQNKRVTPEGIADVVLAKVVEACGLEAHALDAFREPIIELMKKKPPERKLE